MRQSQKLPDYLLSFFRYLRNDEFLIGAKEMSDGLRALEFIDISDVEQFKLTLKIVLCSSREEQEKFDQAFNMFFLENISERENNKGLLHFLSEEQKRDDLLLNESSSSERERMHNEEKSPRVDEAGVEQTVELEEDISANLTGSGMGQKHEVHEEFAEERNKVSIWNATNLMSKETQEIKTTVSSYQFQAMEKAAKEFIKRIKLKQSRRYKTLIKRSKFDLRRTLRESVQFGGYPIKPIWKGHKKEKAKYVLLCDSSRSMSSYADTFLQFAYALTKNTNDVDVFLFSTKLRKVTEQFKRCRNIEFPVLTVLGNEWGGGTCIGESLFSFVQRYGMYLLKKNTIVLIASDGLDAGEIDKLEWAMKEIHGRTSAVIWLNPLLTIDGYEPIARGMKTALPYIDIFSEAACASSFLELANTLEIRR